MEVLLDRALTPEIRERSRVVGAGDPQLPGADGACVLYWMRAALRGHENPALDAALLVARDLGLPMVVYQGLAERYPFASDRHHLFILQGARAVAGELDRRGIRYLLHVEREGHRGDHLRTLVRRAAVVVTEEMPVAPLAGWTRRLAASSTTPVIAVDTACLVPMRLAPWPFERAYEFRRATDGLRRDRLERPWREVAEVVVDASAGAELPFGLPFEPVDLESHDLSRLVGECAIDHGVAPVADSPGGGPAGYARWERFRDDGLGRYHRLRNDPLADGVSRLSPYLHYGMVSPLRIAREAAAASGRGPEKFLDELLVWRELAYAFCFHRPDHASIEALPGWARRTLAAHRGDPRPSLPSWETLARGRTGDPLWDACQRSLLVRGELHNNLRMTWGKALLGWTRSAGEALERLEDLNHRFALDGRDPASYGGILWCLGAFDRPFRPERPILGAVRPRPTSQHARRLDVEAYRRRVGRPTVEPAPTVLVVGAGVSGLACARALTDAGLAVRVVDKGRRAGGRVSTRARDEGPYDHGAQYFTVRDRRFRPLVESWRHDGVVAVWEGPIGSVRDGAFEERGAATERWVGVPSMGAVGRHLASGLTVDRGTRVEGVDRRDRGWSARLAEGGELTADRLVLALPAPQAAALLPRAAAARRVVTQIQMSPCWTVMAAFDQRLPVELDGLFVDDSPLAWAARDGSKPGRPAGERWVLQAGPEWSTRWLEREPEAVADRLLAAFAAATGLPPTEAVSAVAHRWRHARTPEPLGADCLYDRAAGLGLCGDWCPGERVEGAYLSGVALAGEILRDAALETSSPPIPGPLQASLDLEPGDG